MTDPVYTHPTVQIIDRTSTSQARADLLAQILHIQIRDHFKPHWKIGAHFLIAKPPNATAIPIVLLDDADQADALGYHDVGPDGRPYSRVFVKPILDNGGDWFTRNLSVCSVVSHEILELLGDPLCIDWRDDLAGRLWAVEMCDAVERDSYEVQGPTGPATVSNFLLPAYFNPFGAAPYDHLKMLTKPFSLAPGGYAIVMSGGKTSLVFGEEKPPGWRLLDKLRRPARTKRRVR